VGNLIFLLPLLRDAFRHGAYTNNALSINPGNRHYLTITV